MNIPSLRFPEFKLEIENSYKRHFFKDIFLFSTGKNIKQSEASPEFDTPCVRYGELYHMYNEVITGIVNRTNLDKSELRFSDGDEILLPSAGEDPLDIGSASALTIKNVAIGRTINILKPSKANVYSQIYVAYYINQKLRKTISTLAKGVSISNVYNSDLKTLEIILPNLSEQQKIATFLTVVDEKLQTLKQKKSLLEQYKKGVMQKIFSQELRFTDDNGNAFADWEEKKLGDIVTEYNDKSIINDQYVVLSSSMGGIKLQSDYFNKDVSSKNNTGYKIVPNGYFTYRSMSDTGSFTFNIQNIVEIGIVSPAYPVFKPKNFIKSQFLSYYLNNSDRIINDLLSLKEGGTRYALSFSKFSKLEIDIPNLEEQIKIANFLSTIDDKINHCQAQITNTEVWKKGLLQQLFV